MSRNFKEALRNRRTYYQIENKSPISDAQIKEIIDYAIINVPSAFNSQSTRLVLLIGGHHRKLWSIVKETLRKKVPAANFGDTEKKIDSFAAGYGSVMFFEDQKVVSALQADYATYKDYFPVWSHHTCGMHQLAIWTMLEDAGFGASLQHYNPIIDAEVKKTWKLEDSWSLVAQMPFGMPTGQPGDKDALPIDARVKMFV